jgi:hypothetical protein
MKHTKDTRSVLDGPLEFWNVKPTELGISLCFGGRMDSSFQAIRE